MHHQLKFDHDRNLMLFCILSYQDHCFISQLSNCLLCLAEWHFLSFTYSVVICRDHPGAYWSLQSICLPLKLDCCGAESGCALLRLNRNTFGITLFQISIPRPRRRRSSSLSGESRVIPRPACGSSSPWLHLCFTASLFLSLCPCLNRTMQTKWPSKWAAACRLWNKFCRSSLLLPHPLQFLVFLSSEYCYQNEIFTFELT